MLQPRSIVDRYRIDAHIGQGASSEVYKVTHVWLHAPMILKHMREDADREMRAILLEEGRLQCGNVHQNLVAVHDALEIEGRPALVMEFVDGPDLADWIDERDTPPLDQALFIFRGLVEGVGHAHLRGLVHRDLKPENILLQRSPLGFVAKVTDFGLSKMPRGRGPDTLSSVYRLIGTPEYMAPEQIRDPGVADRRSDVFSLGAILYELCTGEMAFGEDPVTDEIETVLARVARVDYPPPKRLRPDLCDELVGLIDAMLSYDPTDRPQSCEDVLAALPK